MQSSPYIELLKKTLCDFHKGNAVEYEPLRFMHKAVRFKNYAVCRATKMSEEMRLNGKGRPLHADTMVGMKRLDNIEFCVNEVIKDNVEGDIAELGVWRGGVSILIMALLKEWNCKDRNVWVVDSFEGLPSPDTKKHPADKGDKHSTDRSLAVKLEEVKNNFEKYNLLDDQVKFLKGWFKDTLPTAPIKKLAVLRLDGDMYGSTMDGLINLYPKLSKGGYIIIDDWGAVPACRKAVEDYRKQQGITELIKEIDWTGVYWKKGK